MLSRLLLIACVLCLSCSPSDETSTTNLRDFAESQIFQTEADRLAHLERTEYAHREAIRDCMANQGFTYEATIERGAVTSDGDDLSRAEFAAEYGYGVAITFLEGAEEQLTDPNVAIRAQLVPEERAAYDRALYGAPFEDYQRDLVQGTDSCLSEAEDAIEPIATLGVMLQEVQSDVESSVEWSLIQDEWVTCMLDSGFDEATHIGWGRETAQLALQVLVQSGHVVLRDGSEQSLSSPIADPSTIESYRLDDTVIAQTLSNERELAVADLRCIESLEERIRTAYEAPLEALVSDSSAEVDRARSFLESGQ